MSLFDFVEEHHSIGPPAHGLGELAGFLVTDVSRRRANQSRDGVLLLVLRHVNPDHRLLIVEQEFRQRAADLGFADACRTQEKKAAERPVRILKARAGAAHRVGDGDDGVVLADHTLMEAFLHLDEFLHLAFHEARHRNVRPSRHHLGDVLFIHLLLEHLSGGRCRRALVMCENLALELRDAAVLQL